MGIELGSSFTRKAAIPLDDSIIIALLANLTTVPTGIRFEGMIVYCKEDKKNYQLAGGIADVNWTAIAGGSGGGGALPAGGVQFGILEKQSATLNDATWTVPVAFDGISARFGSVQFTSNGIKDTLDKILQITYTAPQISLSGSSNILREKGTSVASVLLTSAITKKSNPIGVVRFYQGATLLATQTTGGAIPTGGSSTFTYATAFSDNITFSSQVDDTLVNGNQTLATASSTSYSFVYPYFFGGGAAALTNTGIAALNKDVTSNTNNYSKTVVSAGAQKLYMAYPTAYGALTSILDVNNFEVIPTFTLRTVSITGLDATAQTYNVYESNNVVVAGSYFFQFKK